MPYEKEQQHIIEAVRKASLLTLKVRAAALSTEKVGREPVTAADFGSQACICAELKQAFPNDGVVAEESAADFLGLGNPALRQQVVDLVGDTLEITVSENDVCTWLDHGHGVAANRQWVIDPIDGTKGFLAGRRYTIAVGLLVDGEPVFGVLGCPAYPVAGADDGKLFYGSVGDGAYSVRLNGEEITPITVSKQAATALLRGVESVESAHADHSAMDDIRAQLGASKDHVVRMDGQDKYAAVACGDADYYLRLSPDKTRKERIWDHAAGVAVITAAGGTITDLEGHPLDFSLGKTLDANRGIIASNGIYHDQIVTAVKVANA